MTFRRVICFFTICALTLAFASPALGADISGPSVQPGSLIPGQEGAEDDGIRYLTGRRVYDYDGGSLLLADVGGDLSQLDLPRELACYVAGRAAWEVYWCPVAWQYAAVDTSAPGRVSIPGTLLPGEGYALEAGFSADVSYTAVILCAGAMEAEALDRIEFNLNRKGYITALGEALPQTLQPTAAWCYTRLNESYLAQVHWDFSGVDTSAAGAYPVSGQLQLPVCLDPPQADPGVYASYVYVVDPSCIDLTAVTKDTDTEIYVEWLYRTPQPADMVVEYALGDPHGDWVSNRDYPYKGWYGEHLYGRYDAVSLSIEKSKLLPDTDYYFRIRYGEEISNLLHVRADGTSGAPPETLTQLEAVDTLSYELKLFPTGTHPADFALPHTVLCTYGGRYSVPCHVVWAVDDVDTSAPGWVYVKGSVVPPKGYSIPEGFAAWYPVMLAQEGMAREVLAGVFVSEHFFLVGKDTEISDPLSLKSIAGLSLPEEIEYVTQNALHGAAPVSWDISGVDIAHAGRYAIVGTLDIPPCFALPQQANLSASSVQVMDAHRIDLSGFIVHNSMNLAGSSYWIYTVEDFENITLEYATHPGNWQRAEAEPHGGDMYATELPCRYGSNFFTVQFSSLEDGAYDFRLVYQGEASNVLHVTVDKNAIVEWNIGGDRGGADQGSYRPPDIEQPAPGSNGSDAPGAPPGRQDPQTAPEAQPPHTEQPAAEGDDSSESDTADAPPGRKDPHIPPQTDTGNKDDPHAGRNTADEDLSATPSLPTQADARAPQAGAHADISQSPVPHSGPDDVMMEYSTENTLSISGLRLKEMLALSRGTVLFEKQGVAVELPLDFFAGLEIADSSRFTVRIEKGDNAFTLEIFLDEMPLSALPPTTVYAPFTLADGMDSENLACYDASGKAVSAAVYDAARQLVRVEIQATGSYTVTGRQVAASPVSAITAGESRDTAPLGKAAARAASGPGGAIYAATGLVAAILCAGFVYLRHRSTTGAGSNG